MLYELTCAECNLSFSSAASLLKHFAQHASRAIPQAEESESRNNIKKKANIPDLYPISSFKPCFKKSKLNEDEICDESEENGIDSGIEDLVNPLRYCAVSMEDLPTDNEYSNEKFKNSRILRKYKCTYCTKTFGWSTDLKRHTLTHTGERPFKCSLCTSTFTRKFLLQKHQAKQHSDVSYDIMHSSRHGNKIKIPPLKPIGFIFERKSRKQDKQKIKRKVLNTKNLYQSANDNFEVADNLVCST